jgi:glycosyltransferase involved in cell wall biosynthesis
MSSPTKLVVGSTFPIHPPQGGGQLRIFHLYRRLARRCPVDVIALVDHSAPASRREIAPGLTEIRIPRSEPQVAAEGRLHVAGIEVSDMAFVRLHRLNPAFSEAVARAAVPRCVFVASHPYTLPAMRAADPDVAFWYDAHNVELDLKGAILPHNANGRRLLRWTRAVERDCCRRAQVVLASCAQDSRRLRALYRVPVARMILVPNGVDTAAIRFTPPSERRDLRRRLRLNQRLALFIGSWHEPNLVAAARILELAARFPEVRFAIVGSVAIPLRGASRPANVELFGIVSDELKQALLTVADVALNPMLDGSGTNMKMLDYLAAGTPVISTEVGMRGLDLEPGRDLRVADPPSFGHALRLTLQEADEVADARAYSARRRIEEQFDWEAVAAPLVRLIDGVEGRPRQAPRARSAIRA